MTDKSPETTDTERERSLHYVKIAVRNFPDGAVTWDRIKEVLEAVLFARADARNARIDRLLRNWREFQNMVAASHMWPPEEMRRAQAESWARANVATGDPRFD